jgi:hypothetical protein
VTFTLRSTTAVSNHPFALGQVFRKGDVPSGQALVLDTAGSQITPVSSWDDGSVKHAIVAGRTDLAANTNRTVLIGGGTATGATLTEVDLIAAGPSASVSYGSYGTVTLGALLGLASARVLIEHAGPQYSAFQYIASFPNDASVRAVFYVQLWVGGSYRVRVGVENGTALNTAASKNGTGTVTIAGTQRFSGSVSMAQGTRWDAVGANFAEASALHDVAYLRSTKLVPNYGYTNPGSAALSALPTAYTPMNGLHFETNMGATGYAEAIGLIPHWDAMYCASGDARALDSSLAHGRAYGCYGIFYRDAATKHMPRFADYLTAYSNSEDLNAGGYRWEFAHHPNAGYVPWLLTAERFFLETLQANAWAVFYTNPNSGGVNRLYNSQTRGRAWRLRTLAAVAAVSPTGDPIAADCRANVAANLANWKTVHVDTNQPGTGLVGTYDDKDGGTAGFQHSIFESLFLVSTLGWAWDIEPGLSSTQKSTHQAVRDFAYRVPVGLTGRGQANAEFSYRRAPGPYRMVIGPDSNTANLYATWDAVYDATYGDQLASGDGMAIMESYADDQSADAFPQGNWGHLITALSYAKDHGAAGAAASYARVTGASNWSGNATKFNKWPGAGVLSRN